MNDDVQKGGAVLWLFISLVVAITFFIGPLWHWIADLLK